MVIMDNRNIIIRALKFNSGSEQVLHTRSIFALFGTSDHILVTHSIFPINHPIF